MVATPLLEARGLHKRLRRRQVLRGADLVVWPGEVVGIAGENGSGKTTLLRILTGMLAPDQGHVNRYCSVGYAPQTPLVYEQLTPWEHFRYFASARDLRDVWMSGAEALMQRYRFDAWRHQPAGQLSGGTRQKLNLALALLPDPALLMLDEPYDGFEWETYNRFWDHVRELRQHGRSAIIVSHLFYDRKQLDRVVELRDGQLHA